MARAKAQVRVETCDRNQARTRYRLAQQFYSSAVAITVENADSEDLAYLSAAASLAVLAGIAAADAACCQALGQRSRGQNHTEAEKLLSAVEPKGREAANCLHRLLDSKDSAHYGLIQVSKKDLKQALRQAEKLVEFATVVLQK